MSICVTNEANVCIIAFNRPEKKNAITAEMYQQMADALVAATNDTNVKVVLFQGKGEHFSAGNDLKDFLANPSMDEDSSVYQFLMALEACPLPVVAAVEGFAIGIGSTLLLHCEQVFADSEAKFALPFINLGLVPEAGSSLLLPRLCGYQKAAKWLLTGDVFTAQDAEKAGFISQVCEGDTKQQALAFASQLAAKPRSSLVATKTLLKRDEEPLADRMQVELKAFVEGLNSEAAKEAMTAFIEKRPADFSKF